MSIFVQSQKIIAAQWSRALLCCLVFSVFVISSVTYAQGTGGGAEDGLPQIGAFTGKILPKSIPGASEIFSLTGGRYSHPLSKTGYVEGGGLFGNGQGVIWKSLFLSLSMRIPIETLIGHAGIGIDFTRYESDTTETKNIGGMHFIGGILSHIGGNAFARFDMKLSSKPGTSLFFGIGLVLEVDFFSGGGGSEN